MGESHDRKKSANKRAEGRFWALLTAAVLLGAIVLTLILVSSGVLSGLGNGAGTSGTEKATIPQLPQQANADYEKWLAAAMVVGISMEYPEFEIAGIYTSSETPLSEKRNSDGVYIVLTNGAQNMVLHSMPLDGERTVSGTKDISSQVLGFASFDLVDPASVKTDSMMQIEMEELTELISPSLLISIYPR